MNLVWTDLDRHAAPISSEGTGKLVVSLQPAGHSDHLLCPAQLPSALAPVAANGFIGRSCWIPGSSVTSDSLEIMTALTVDFSIGTSTHQGAYPWNYMNRSS